MTPPASVGAVGRHWHHSRQCGSHSGLSKFTKPESFGLPPARTRETPSWSVPHRCHDPSSSLLGVDFRRVVRPKCRRPVWRIRTGTRGWKLFFRLPLILCTNTWRFLPKGKLERVSQFACGEWVCWSRFGGGHGCNRSFSPPAGGGRIQGASRTQSLVSTREVSEGESFALGNMDTLCVLKNPARRLPLDDESVLDARCFWFGCRQVVAKSPDVVVLVCSGQHLNSTDRGAFQSRNFFGSVHRSQRFSSRVCLQEGEASMPLRSLPFEAPLRSPLAAPLRSPPSTLQPYTPPSPCPGRPAPGGVSPGGVSWGCLREVSPGGRVSGGGLRAAGLSPLFPPLPFSPPPLYFTSSSPFFTSFPSFPLLTSPFPCPLPFSILF